MDARAWLELFLGSGFLITLFKWLTGRAKNKEEVRKLHIDNSLAMDEIWHKKFEELKDEMKVLERLYETQIERTDEWIGKTDDCMKKLDFYLKGLK